MTKDRPAWSFIPGYGDMYLISSEGVIISLVRHDPVIMRQGTDEDGYKLVNLTRALGEPAKTAKVHQLMLEAFVGPKPPGMLARHLNGVRDANVLDNLRWGTPEENMQDKVAHGNHSAANKAHCPKGHAYSGDNLVIERTKAGRVSRKCRTCMRTRARQYRAARREREGTAFTAQAIQHEPDE